MRFDRDRASALPLPAHAFDACIFQPAQVDKYQTVQFDHNRYSVPRGCAFHAVTVKGYIDRVEVVAMGTAVVARHRRSYGRDEQILDPLHYLATLGRRPAALDHAPVTARLATAGGRSCTLRQRLEQRHGRDGWLPPVHPRAAVAGGPSADAGPASRREPALDRGGADSRTDRRDWSNGWPRQRHGCADVSGDRDTDNVIPGAPARPGSVRPTTQSHRRSTCQITQHAVAAGQSEAAAAADDDRRVREAGPRGGRRRRELRAVPAAADRTGSGGAGQQRGAGTDPSGRFPGAQGLRHLRLHRCAAPEQAEGAGVGPRRVDRAERTDAAWWAARERARRTWRRRWDWQRAGRASGCVSSLRPRWYERAGYFYTASLKDEQISCAIRNDKAGELKYWRLFSLCCEEKQLDEFPHYGFEGSQGAMCKDIVTLERDNRENHYAALLRTFEPFREHGTLFRKKGYPAEAELAIELLREKIIAQYTNNTWKLEQGIYFIWACVWLCRIPCFIDTKSEEFIKAVNTGNLLSLLSCLRLSVIIKESLNDDYFYKLLGKHNLDAEKLALAVENGMDIEWHTLPSLIRGEDETTFKRDPGQHGLFRATDRIFELITLAIAQGYYTVYLKETPQSFTEKEIDKLEYSIGEHYCGSCSQKESLARFKVCSACRQIRYCSDECRDADRLRHEAACAKKNIDEQKEKSRAEIRRAEFEKVLEKRVRKVRNSIPTELEKSELNAQLALHGNQYREFLKERCINALAMKDAGLESAVRLWIISRQEAFTTIFPLATENVFARLGRKITALEFFKRRIEDSEELTGPDAFTLRYIEFLRTLEPHRGEATLFRNKGYSPYIELTLDYMRLQIIQHYFEETWSVKQALWFIWAYRMLCTVPCLLPNCEDLFMVAVHKNNEMLLMSCLNKKALFEHALREDGEFKTLLTQYVCSSGQFLQALREKDPASLAYAIQYRIPNRLTRSPFSYLAYNFDRITFALARSYYQAYQAGQAKKD